MKKANPDETLGKSSQKNQWNNGTVEPIFKVDGIFPAQHVFK